MLKSKKSARFSPFIAIILMFNTIFLNVHAAVPLSFTDFVYPGTVGMISDGVLAEWSLTELEKIKMEDGTMAGLGLRGDRKSTMMTATGFSMSIPTNALITGVQVEIGRAYFGDTPLVDYIVRLINASGSPDGNNYADIVNGWNAYPDATAKVYGGPTDLWGLSSISVSDLMSPKFGVAFAAQNTGISADYTTAFVDFIRIKVYYSVDMIRPELTLVNSPEIYSGTQKVAEVTANVAGVINDIKYNDSSEVPTNVGTYAITADFLPDNTTLYQTLDDSYVGDFVINQATPDLMVTNPTVAYTGFQQSSSVSSSISGTVDDIRYNNSGVVPTEPGTYTITADFTPDDTLNYAYLNDEFAGTFQISAPITYYSVTVTSNIPEGGTAYGEASYATGELATVTATANPGYTFVSWTEGGTVVSNLPVYSFNMGTADRSLTANFQVEIISTPLWPKGIRLTATSITSSSVTLLISQSVPNVEKYVIYWDNQKLDFVVSSGTSFKITDLNPGTSYKFQIQAVIGGVETKNGPTKSIKTRK